MLAKKLLGSRQAAAASSSGTIVVSHEHAPYVTGYQWSAGFGTVYNGPGVGYFSNPVSDITTANWQRPGGGTNPYWSYLVDKTNRNDQALSTTVINAPLEVKFGAITDPQSSSNHVVRLMMWSINSSGAGEQRTILLLQGTTTIATLATGSVSRQSGTIEEYTLTAAQADSITDYSDLRIRVTATQLGSGEVLLFSWAQLDFKNAQGPGPSNSVAFSPDGTTIVLAHDNSPGIVAYPWSNGFGTKYADPATLPTGNNLDVAFSPNGAAVAVAHLISPFVSVYPWSNGFGTKYANPATLPSFAFGVAFSPNSATIAVAHDASPYINAYPWNPGFGTKYADPATLPTGSARGVAFSPNGAAIAVTHSNSPYISVYPWNPGFGAKYADPATLPDGQGSSVTFSPDSATIALIHFGTSTISVYPWNPGFGTKYASPVTLPLSTPGGVAFSPDGTSIAIATSGSSSIYVYPWSNGFGTKYADPATLPAGAGNGVTWRP